MKVAEFITMINEIMPNDVDESMFINWVNVLEDTIYEKFIHDRVKPTLKTLQNISVDNLDLMAFGYRWLKIYEYFVLGQVSIRYEEFNKANNYFMLYNSLIDEFAQQYLPTIHNTVRESRLKNYR